MGVVVDQKIIKLNGKPVKLYWIESSLCYSLSRVKKTMTGNSGGSKITGGRSESLGHVGLHTEESELLSVYIFRKKFSAKNKKYASPPLGRFLLHILCYEKLTY